jgi:hypothetical protein
MFAVSHVVPVACPTVAVKVPPCSTGLEQRYPDPGMQVVPTKELLLNTPNENRAPSTIAMINMAQPYVMRYSMALCALKFLAFENILTPS